MICSPRTLHAAVSDLAGRLLTGHVADLRPMPGEPLGSGQTRAIRRYLAPDAVIPTGPPVLFVPPPGTPARCFDLRRGCSVAEHVIRSGRRAYLLGDEPLRRTDRDPGLEYWAGEVLATAVREVSADAGGQPVQVVAWSLGGLISLFASAADRGLPIASIAVIATPAQVTDLPPAPPPRPLTRVSRGLETATAGAFVGVPPWPQAAQLCRTVGGNKYLARPYAFLRFLDNSAFLAQIDAVDRVGSTMPAYLGRTAERLYRSLFHTNALSADGVDISGRRVRLSRIRVPVLLVAGHDDEIAPAPAVYALTRLLTGSPDVRFAAAPGGHLGVLTGRRARRTTWVHLDRWLDEGAIRHGMRPGRRPITASL